MASAIRAMLIAGHVEALQRQTAPVALKINIGNLLTIINVFVCSVTLKQAKESADNAILLVIHAVEKNQITVYHVHQTAAAFYWMATVNASLSFMRIKKDSVRLVTPLACHVMDLIVTTV